jgi:hypothetical protein
MPRTRISVLLLLLPLCSSALLAQNGVTPVPPGREVRENKLLSPTLTDVWKLDVEEDEVLGCTVDSAQFDPVLELYDVGGERLGANNSEHQHAELWQRMPHKGAVELRVHGFQGQGGGQYSFWLQRWRTEPLAAHGEARHRFGEEQWWHWRVTLHQGDILVPTLDGDGRLTAVFDELRQGVIDDHGGFQALHDGDYYLRVEGPKDRACGIQTQLARQRELPAGGVDDVVPPFGCDVIYLRELLPGTAGALDLAMPGPQLEFDPREAASPEPAFAWPGHLDKGGLRHRFLFVRRNKVLAVLLRNRGGAPAPFRFALQPASAVLQAGAPANAMLAVGGGDLWRLDAHAGDLLRLQLSSRAFDARFDVWDPDGNIVASAVDDRAPLDRDAELTFLVPRSGAWHVLAYCHTGGGDYELRADVLPVPELRPGASLPVHVDDGGTSYLHLTLQQGQEAWLAVRSKAFDARLTVIDPTGNASFVREGGGVGGDVLAAFLCTQPGVHTLLVQSRRGAGAGEVCALLPDGRPARVTGPLDGPLNGGGAGPGGVSR